MSEKNSKYKYMAAMSIFGTIGIFVKNINLSSAVICLARALIGFVFLLFITILQKQKHDIKLIKKSFFKIAVSGVFMGLNWVTLFEAYKYTSVSVATLCYYMAPIILIVLSPFVFNEKPGLRKVICVFTALFGMVLVSGVLVNPARAFSGIKGIGLGIISALLYSFIVIINKKTLGVSPYIKTLVQFFFAFITMLIYIIFTENFSSFYVDGVSLILLIILGIFHTGFAYSLYFGSIEKLDAQTVAVFSYLDPIVTLILSAVILKENIGITGIIGAVLILFATFFSDKIDLSFIFKRGKK